MLSSRTACCFVHLADAPSLPRGFLLPPASLPRRREPAQPHTAPLPTAELNPRGSLPTSPKSYFTFVHCSQVHPSLPSLLDSAMSCKSGCCFAPFPRQFSCSCSLVHSFRVRCFFLSNSSCKLESHVPQMILSLIRRSFMSLMYICMPEFSATRCKHLSSSLLLAFGI